MMRVAPGREFLAAARRRSFRRLVRRKGPRWLAASWVSTPSGEYFRSKTLRPALLIRMSKRGARALISSAALRTETCEIKSTRTDLTLTWGLTALISAITSSSLDCVRETSISNSGSWSASARAAAPPRPDLETPVMATVDVQRN